jgi:hypothetical protein
MKVKKPKQMEKIQLRRAARRKSIFLKSFIALEIREDTAS